MTERSFERIWRHVCEKDVESLRRIHEDVFDCLKIGQDLEMMKKAIEISETPEDVRLVALLRAKNMYVDIGRCLQYAGRLGRKNVYTTILGGSPSPSSYLCYCMDEESARMCINIPPDDPSDELVHKLFRTRVANVLNVAAVNLRYVRELRDDKYSPHRARLCRFLLQTLDEHECDSLAELYEEKIQKVYPPELLASLVTREQRAAVIAELDALTGTRLSGVVRKAADSVDAQAPKKRRVRHAAPPTRWIVTRSQGRGRQAALKAKAQIAASVARK